MVFSGEKALRTNKARLRELAAFEIGMIERNGESIGMRAARDLAENQGRILAQTPELFGNFDGFFFYSAAFLMFTERQKKLPQWHSA